MSGAVLVLASTQLGAAETAARKACTAEGDMVGCSRSLLGAGLMAVGYTYEAGLLRDWHCTCPGCVTTERVLTQAALTMALAQCSKYSLYP